MLAHRDEGDLTLLKKIGIRLSVIENGTFDERKLELDRLDLAIAQMRRRNAPGQSALVQMYETISKNHRHELYDDIIQREA